MIKVNTQTNEATRAVVPINIRALSNYTLNNLQTELNPVPYDLIDMEYWPENRLVQSIKASQKFGSEVLTVNTTTRLVDVSYTIEDKTAEDLASEAEYTASETAKLAAAAREKRDKLLAATDWVVLRAKELGQTVPLDVFEYRGDLRQLPEQAGFPSEITWPTKP